MKPTGVYNNKRRRAEEEEERRRRRRRATRKLRQREESDQSSQMQTFSSDEWELLEANDPNLQAPATNNVVDEAAKVEVLRHLCQLADERSKEADTDGAGRPPLCVNDYLFC